MKEKEQAAMPDWEQWRAFIQQQAPALGLTVTGDQTRCFAVHARELADWNRKFNLTAITDPTETAVKHFLDSLAPSRFIPDGAGLLDVGTGAGFPGIPLKIVRPSLSLTLIDGTLKKINFVRHVIQSLELDRTAALHARAESLGRDPAFRGAFDVVICRALGPLPDFVRVAAPLIRENGRLIAMKGGRAEEELEQLEKFKLPLGPKKVAVKEAFKIDLHPYTLPASGDQRALIVLTLTAPF